MILNLKDISYILPNRETLFSAVSLSIDKSEKASLIGDNGTGKSTLLRIVAGEVVAAGGEISCLSKPYYVPQHSGQYDRLTVAGALGIENKISALAAITAGSTDEHHYATLDDDWDVEQRAVAALAEWGMGGFGLDCPMSRLSGGEKTRVFLAGTGLHKPELILMDEPSNHLDAGAREKLYAFIRESRATLLVVSHDRTLLNLLDRTYVLSSTGVASYGGNYDFYREMRDIESEAAHSEVHEGEKALRKARQTAREAAERKARRDSRGGAKMKKEGVPRIMLKTITDGAAASDKRLRDTHATKLNTISESLRESRGRLPQERDLRIKLGDSGLHSGKMLVESEGIGFAYGSGPALWNPPLSLRIASGGRIAIRGGNGSGKTTLVKLITGKLEPTAGIMRRAEFSSLYIDQEYSVIDPEATVAGFAAAHNRRNLPESAVKTELHRFLFPATTWDKPCYALSGGEKMRLIFCALVIGDSAPDMFILDEPTNNLDIASLEIVSSALRGYGGTLLVISHDARFLQDVGISSYIDLG